MAGWANTVESIVVKRILGGDEPGRRVPRHGGRRDGGQGIINAPQGLNGLVVVLAALTGAIAWNLSTWFFGIPSSSSHALIGGLVGAALGSAGAVQWADVLGKVVIPMVLSPTVGFALAAITSSILGVGATKRLSAVGWGVAGNILVAWGAHDPDGRTHGRRDVLASTPPRALTSPPHEQAPRAADEAVPPHQVAGRHATRGFRP